MLRPIVVGLDGSRESVAAADWAAREALRRGLPLRVVHAWEGLPRDGEAVSLPELSAPQYWARRILRGTLDRLCERYPQVSVTAEQIGRSPVPALLDEAGTAESLVLGSQGFGGLGGLLAGSVAMAVVAHAPTPVVLVRAGFDAVAEHLPDGSGAASATTPHRSVVAAVDLRHSCDSVLSFAFEAAQRRAAPLHVVHAWRLPNTRGATDEQGHVPTQRDAEWVLETVLEPWRDKYPDLTVHATADQGRPVHVVLRAAQHAGLLVLGREMRRGKVGTHVGRVTHMAIRQVSCPVAVVAHA
ncbi:universal stress protein [Streptomyces spectabilis]|uniref:Nucleotide-binding universal stress UspA family protein n=1 Tax=Streptomyces spectabilis TaxID=68270 RepID=A0A5P2XGU5_STRST|nr:universal stress protein [Streptomyces spectabilis]MBB5102402.1 nucleotide-binding universal stress UspA family protein [Streptomyces spectabilis]MCI3907445.1 universal stress protein [Streptomyces spectabilis]QEV64153.1 universal stress protein [Streptomyces spectabilis]GGV32049.1 stress-inducible protein [Streptomyces spectabilis]